MLKHEGPSKHPKAGHHRTASETPFEWCFAGGPIVAGHCVLAGVLYLQISYTSSIHITVAKQFLISVLFLLKFFFLEFCKSIICWVEKTNSRFYYPTYFKNRGSYRTAHVLLNLLNELGKRDQMRGLPSILSLFRNELNKFNNTRARMLDSIYHMTNTLKSHF